MLPLIAGFLIAGPVSGCLSDRYGARPFATGGMVAAALSFLLLELLPVDFSYVAFAALLLLNGLAMGLFSSPNRAGDHEQPAGRPARRRRGHERDVPEPAAGAVDRHLLLADDRRPRREPARRAMHDGLVAHGVPAADATRVAHLPPVASLFAAFLGYNPMQHLLGPHVARRPPATRRPRPSPAAASSRR